MEIAEGPLQSIDGAPLQGSAGSAREPAHQVRRLRSLNGAAFEAEDPAEGRVAVVSGGNRGLGLEIVRVLAESGMRVVLGSRCADTGRAAVELLGDLESRVVVRQLDITDHESVYDLAAWLGRRLKRCDVLINNAAVLDDTDAEPSTADMDEIQLTVDTNLVGTWRLTQAIVPLMRRGMYGRIVNISSDYADLSATAAQVGPAYVVSKAGVNVLTRLLAEELAADGILVNACNPEPVHSQNPSGGRAMAASADTPTWLATLPDNGPTGGFYGHAEAPG